MREILFRGKPLGKLYDNFIYGSLGVICEDLCAIYYCHEFIDDDIQLVDIGTVGQYTGLTDKNGKKIFEGDILKRKHKELLNHSQKMTVNYIPYEACFSAVDIGGGNVTFISDYINNKYELEIIGNIHDNPELLKEAEQE